MPPYTIQPARRRVGREALPGVSQTANASGAFGGNEAAAIAQFGRDIQTTAAAVGRRTEAEELQEQKIMTARDKATAELQERKDKMYAQQDMLEYQDRWRTENQEFLGTKRLNADGVTKKATEWHNKTKDGIIGRSQTQRQKELFNSLLAPVQTNLLDKVSEHEIKQLSLAEVELSEAIYTNAVISAGTPDSNEVDLVNAEITAIDALNVKYKGFDDETKKKAVADGMAAYHTAVINGKLVADLPFAKEYFKDNKQLIPPKEREVIRLAIRKEDVSQSSIRIADEIALTVEDNNEWMQQVEKKTKDPEIQKQTKSILDAKKKDEAAHDAELIKRERDDILTAVHNAGNLEEGLLVAAKAEDIDNKILAEKTANSLYARKKRDVETNIPVFAQVLDRINNGEFNTATELLEFYPDLSNADYKGLVNSLETYQKTAKTGKKADDGVIKYSTAKAAFSTAQNEDYDTEDDEQNMMFIDAYEKVQEANITDELGAIKYMRNLTLEGTIRGRLWDDDLTRQEAETEGRLGEWLPNIFEEDEDLGLERRTIEAALRSRGIVTNDEIIKRLFKKDVILGLPLTDKEKREYRIRIGKAGKTRPVRRGQ